MAHSRIVYNVCPQKEKVTRTRLIFGGQNLDVPLDCGTPIASMMSVRLLLNSVIYTPKAEFMIIDMKDFYLNTPMNCPEYLRMKLSHFPEDAIEYYKQED